MSVLAGIATIAKTKAAAGLAVAALTSGAAVAAAAPSSEVNSDGTHQSNAQAFGQKVVAHVATCKAALDGEHGIGKCLSAWVKDNNPGAAHRNAAADNANGTHGKPDSAHGPTTPGQSGATHGSQSGTHPTP